MMATVAIACWKNKECYFNFDHSRGERTPERDREGVEVAGFLWESKKGPIYCYSYNGSRWLRFRDHVFDMKASKLTVSVKRNWPFLTTTVKHPTMDLVINEFAPIGLITTYLDLTYDALDFTTDFFGGYVQEQFLSARGK